MAKTAVKETKLKTDTASSPIQSADTIPAGVTLAEHVQAHAAAIDAQLGELNAAKEAVVADLNGASKAASLVKTQQLKTLEGVIAASSAEKNRILNALEILPAEIHDLEARLLAELKSLFQD